MVSAYYADLGMTRYADALRLQHELVSMRERNMIPDIVLLTEHYPCILFGRDQKKNSFSSKFLQILEKENKTAEEYLTELGIDIFREGRYGGGASYIGPGQLIVYPINVYSRLTKTRDIPAYKLIVDKTMLGVMRDFDIGHAYIAEGFNPETQRDRRDVWIDVNGKSHKIAAKGILMGRKVASHGFQLYVSNEGLRYFEFVDPCGYTHDQVGVISMEEVTGVLPDMEEVKKSVLKSIRENFKYDSVEKCSIETGKGVRIKTDLFP